MGPTMAHAEDTFSGTRYDMNEIAHTVVVKVDRGFATLVVTRTVENQGPKADQARFDLSVPTSSVATRLRSRGDNGTWFEAELMDADDAAKKYQELTGYGGAYPKDPALLSWHGQGGLVLQVFPVTARSRKTVEYTLNLPLTYEGGVYTMSTSTLGTTELPATLRFVPAHEGDTIRVNGVPVSAMTEVSAKETLTVTLTPPAVRRLEGSVAAVKLENDRSLFRAALEIPARLGVVPEGAAIAVVLDTSKSIQSPEQSVRAARAYLSHFRNARVTVLTFDRTVEAPFGAALPVRDAITRLTGYVPTLHNGSQLDDALARADSALLLDPSTAKRIVVFTDLRTKDEISPDKISKVPMRSGAILHVGSLQGTGSTLERDDDNAWAQVPRRTGGLLWNMPDSDTDATTLKAHYEEWARPKHIHKVAMTGMPASFSVPDVLDEGSELADFHVRTDTVSAVSLRGELWSKQITVPFTRSANADRRWAGFVFGSDLLDELTEPERRICATLGHAVSPVTSLLAIEPGVRPSTEGLEEGSVGEGGGGRGEGIGLGRIGTIGHGSSSPIEPLKVLQASARAAWDKCLGKGEVEITTETTLDEVVSVRATLATANPIAEKCVNEAMWALDLPSQHFVLDHDTYVIKATR
jgi:hypothetical protein